MFIFNYSNEDLTVAIRGHVQTLAKNELSYVDENWVSLQELKNMFGNYIEIAEQGTAIEEYFFDNQFVPEYDILYLTQFLDTGVPRLFIKDGTINIYSSDAVEVPQTKTDMVALADYQGIQDLVVFPTLTKYMMFEVASGEPKIVISNVQCYPSKQLA